MNNTINKISHSFLKYLIFAAIIITITAVNSHSLAVENIPSEEAIRRLNNLKQRSFTKENFKEILLPIVKEIFIENVKDNLGDQNKIANPLDNGFFVSPDISYSDQVHYQVIFPDSIFFKEKGMDERLPNISKYGLNQLPNLDFKDIVQKAINKEIIIVSVENIQINSKDIVSIGIANRGLIAFAVDKETIQKAAQGQANTIATQGLIAFKADEITNIIEKTINLEGFKKANKVEVNNGVVRIVEITTEPEPRVDTTLPVLTIQKEDIPVNKPAIAKGIFIAETDTPTRTGVFGIEEPEVFNNNDTIKPGLSNEYFSGNINDGNNKSGILERAPEGEIPYNYPPLKALTYPYPFGPPLASNTQLNLQLDNIRKAVAAGDKKPPDKPLPYLLSSTAKSHIQQASIVLLRELNTSIQYHQHFDLPELSRNLSLTSSQFNNPFLSPPDKVPN